MKKEKKKGGSRKGAGRKPSEIRKEPITIYADISKFGTKEGARTAIYKFLDGNLEFNPNKPFINIAAPQKITPIIEDLLESQSSLKPQETKKIDLVDKLRNADIEDKILAIKAEKCPKERDTAMGRKSWQVDQQKRIEELQKQLK